MNTIFQKILTTTGYKISVFIVSFFTLSLTTRWLGPEGRGIIASVTTWLSLFCMVGNLSMGQVAVHEAARSENDHWFSGIFGGLVYFTILLTIISWAIVIILYKISNTYIFNNINPLFLIIGFIGLPFAIWEQYGANLLIALDRLHFYNRAQLFSKIISAIIMALGWLSGGGITIALIAIIIGQIVTASGGITFLLKKTEWRIRTNTFFLSRLLRGGLKLNLGAIGLYLASSSGILIVAYFHNASEVGFFQLALQLMNFMTIIPLSASQVLYGSMVDAGQDEAWTVFRTPFLRMMLIMVACGILAYITVPFFIPIIAGDKFNESIDIFRWGLIVLFENSFTTMMANIWIIKGWFWQISIIQFLSGIITILFGIFLIPTWGNFGGILSMIYGYGFYVTINFLLFIKIEHDWKVNFKIQPEPR